MSLQQPVWLIGPLGTQLWQQSQLLQLRAFQRVPVARETMDVG